MSRYLYVKYEEYGIKFGKVHFYLDKKPVLALKNLQAGVIDIPDAGEHVVSARSLGFIPVFKGRITPGNSDWQLVFVQESRFVDGRFVLSRVANDEAEELVFEKS